MILNDIVSILGAVESGEIFIGSLPEQPDCASAVYLAGGEGAIRTLDGGAVQRPQFKITVRDASAQQAIARAAAIATLLDGYSGGGIASIRVSSCFACEGRDERGRSLLSAEFAAQHEGSG